MSGDDSYHYSVTISDRFAHALAAHYQHDPSVSSVPDALRRAGCDVLGSNSE